MHRGRFVIVADDDDDIRECLASVLGDEGFEVRLAHNGREALDLLDVLGDDRCVLLLDLTMPVMSGFDVLALLARTGRIPALPVIVCSALNGLEPLPFDVRRVIGKPIALDGLLRAIVEQVSPAPASNVRLRAALTDVLSDQVEARARRPA